MTSQKYDALPSFFDALSQVTTPASDISGKPIPDLGLIIFETEEVSLPEAMKRLSAGVEASNIILQKESSADEFADTLARASEKGNWLFVVSEDDPASPVIGILKEISEKGVLLQNGKEIPLHEKTRVVVLVNAETLEKKITYPYFMEMFGPIARI